MRITNALWRRFTSLDDRLRPVQGIIVMWVLFGVLAVMFPGFRDSLRPWSVEPIEAPVIILLALFVIDIVGQAIGWVRARKGSEDRG
jgi:hypothetical protein